MKPAVLMVAALLVGAATTALCWGAITILDGAAALLDILALAFERKH